MEASFNLFVIVTGNAVDEVAPVTVAILEGAIGTADPLEGNAPFDVDEGSKDGDALELDVFRLAEPEEALIEMG